MTKDTITQIEKLLNLIKESGLSEVSLEVEGIKLQARRDAEVKVSSTAASLSAPAVVSPSISSINVEATSPPASTEEQPTITAPMIGTFYASPSPDEAPFVRVGDAVQSGQTVCIIEAMKLFNEIEAEKAGTVVEILVENGAPVEYDQPLFRLESA